MTTLLEQPLGYAVPARRERTVRGWQQEYARTLVGVDFAMLAVAGVVSVRWRFGAQADAVHGITYYGVALALVCVWVAVLGATRCYETRFLGWGTDEFKRVGNASLRLAAVITFIAYAFQLPLSRGFVAAFLPTGSMALVAGRYGARRVVHRARERGEFVHKVLLVGNHPQIKELSSRLARESAAGLRVVGACVPGARECRMGLEGHSIPVVGAIGDIPDAIARLGADTVAVASSPGANGEVLRRLSYELEGTGIDLLVAPSLTYVAGTRISIRPVAGLPLLHVEEPELTGGRKLAKAAFDRGVALVGLLIIAPLLLVVAAAVRLTSSGPALFRQERVGRDGSTFSMLKFRSMYADAESRLDAVAQLNETDGVLFKVRNDPRITRVGKFIRRYSIDELPQLINVVRGDMSLVGPRPPLPREVERYDGHTGRRLLVKPGLTGLWQVSGRSDLSWEDSVGLDLHYVDNWSLALDVSVLAKTFMSVVRARGAY